VKLGIFYEHPAAAAWKDGDETASTRRRSIRSAADRIGMTTLGGRAPLPRGSIRTRRRPRSSRGLLAAHKRIRLGTASC